MAELNNPLTTVAEPACLLRPDRAGELLRHRATRPRAAIRATATGAAAPLGRSTDPPATDIREQVRERYAAAALAGHDHRPGRRLLRTERHVRRRQRSVRRRALRAG